MGMNNDEYVAKGGCCCPFCESDVEGGPITIETFDCRCFARQEVWCLTCGKRWTDEYALAGYIEWKPIAKFDVHGRKEPQ